MLKDLEARAGVSTEDSLGDVQVVSVSGWPAHDLLMLVQEDVKIPKSNEISGIFGKNLFRMSVSLVM